MPNLAFFLDFRQNRLYMGQNGCALFWVDPNWTDSSLTLKRHFDMLAAAKSNFLSLSVGIVAFRK